MTHLQSPTPLSFPILLDVLRAVLETRDINKFFSSSVEVLRRYLPEIDLAVLGRYHEADNSMEIFTTEQRPGVFSQPIGTRTEALPDSPSGWLLKNRRPLLVEDTDLLKERYGIDLNRYCQDPLGSGIGLLLEHGDRVVGSFFLASRNRGAFNREHLDLVENLRPIMALALENAVAFQALDQRRERAELEGEYFREEINEKFPLDGMVGASRAWRSVLQQVRSVALTDSTVLILGETGTGKELVARALHERSARARKPFIKVNCGALTETLIESELFGHERGAFTGAHARRAGRFELADGGTLFLDEIGEMPLSSQVKLLRVLQEREFERVGGTGVVRVNVRVLAATNKDLDAEARAGRFREDLLYRLKVFPIVVPPLRERRDDVPLLAQYFLERFVQQHGRGPMRFSEEALADLVEYPWPGNVRELEHLIERAVILSADGLINIRPFLRLPAPSTFAATPLPMAPLPTPPLPFSASGSDSRGVAPTVPGLVPLKATASQLERTLIERALRDSGGVIGGKKGAAARLGLKRQTLQSKLKKYGIDPTLFRTPLIVEIRA